MLRIGSIFSGIGGLELGLELGGGFKTIWQCEINPFCRKVLRKHWPDTHIFKDIRTLEEDIVYTQSKGFDLSIDLLCGGDPCQENSAARVGGNCTAPSMGQDFINTVRFLRPTFVLRENPSRVRKDAPWPWWRIRSELEEIGYGCVPFRLRSCCLGGGHRRDRLYLFGSLTYAKLHRCKRRFIKKCDMGRKPLFQVSGLCRRGAAPKLIRKPIGLPYGLDRIRTLGNAVDVRQSYYIGSLIREWLSVQ